MPPKKTTLTYSSEDVRSQQESDLRVYYCRYSGKPALITDALLRDTPRRTRDGAFVLDTRKCNVRMIASKSKPILLRRADGKGYEKQQRFVINGLPVAYTIKSHKLNSSCQNYVYIVPDALTSHSASERSAQDRPVPPCIRQEEGGTSIAVVLQDMQPANRLRRVGADEVTFGVRDPAEDVKESLAQMVARMLRVKLSAVHVYPGRSLQSRVVKVENLSPREVYERLSTEDLVANQRNSTYPLKRRRRF